MARPGIPWSPRGGRGRRTWWFLINQVVDRVLVDPRGLLAYAWPMVGSMNSSIRPSAIDPSAMHEGNRGPTARRSLDQRDRVAVVEDVGEGLLELLDAGIQVSDAPFEAVGRVGGTGGERRAPDLRDGLEQVDG